MSQRLRADFAPGYRPPRSSALVLSISTSISIDMPSLSRSRSRFPAAAPAAAASAAASAASTAALGATPKRLLPSAASKAALRAASGGGRGSGGGGSGGGGGSWIENLWDRGAENGEAARAAAWYPGYTLSPPPEPKAAPAATVPSPWAYGRGGGPKRGDGCASFATPRPFGPGQPSPISSGAIRPWDHAQAAGSGGSVVMGNATAFGKWSIQRSPRGSACLHWPGGQPGSLEIRTRAGSWSRFSPATPSTWVLCDCEGCPGGEWHVWETCPSRLAWLAGRPAPRTPERARERPVADRAVRELLCFSCRSLSPLRLAPLGEAQQPSKRDRLDSVPSPEIFGSAWVSPRRFSHLENKKQLALVLVLVLGIQYSVPSDQLRTYAVCHVSTDVGQTCSLRHVSPTHSNPLLPYLSCPTTSSLCFQYYQPKHVGPPSRSIGQYLISKLTMALSTSSRAALKRLIMKDSGLPQGVLTRIEALGIESVSAYFAYFAQADYQTDVVEMILNHVPEHKDDRLLRGRLRNAWVLPRSEFNQAVAKRSSTAPPDDLEAIIDSNERIVQDDELLTSYNVTLGRTSCHQTRCTAASAGGSRDTPSACTRRGASGPPPPTPLATTRASISLPKAYAPRPSPLLATPPT